MKMASATATKTKFVDDGKGNLKKVEGGKVDAPPPAPKKKRAAAATSAPQVVGAKKETYEARMRKLKPIDRVRRKCASTILRFKNLTDEIREWRNAPQLSAAAAVVLEALNELEKTAKTMPDGFAPERDRKTRESHLQAGTKVRIRQKKAADYEGVIDSAELEVIEVRKGRVVCKCDDGAKVFIPRGHLEVVGQEPDDDEDDSDEDDSGEE